MPLPLYYRKPGEPVQVPRFGEAREMQRIIAMLRNVSRLQNAMVLADIHTLEPLTEAADAA